MSTAHDSINNVARRCSATTAGHDELLTDTSALLAQITIVQAVDGEIETGVQVRQHGRVQVNSQR